MTEKIKPNKKTMYAYIFFWIGQIFSLFGSSIAGFVIVWWITIKTGSAIYLSIAAFLGFGTQMLVMPFAGVLIDRWNRKKILGTADISEAIVTFVLIAIFYIGDANIYWVLGISGIRGIFQGFRDASIQAIIPIMIPTESLTRINSLNYLLNGTIFMVGPVIASLLISLFGLNNMPLLLSVDTLTFITALIPLILIKIPDVRYLRKLEKPEFKKEFKQGVEVIRQRKGLFSLLSAFTFANFFLTPLGILLPLIVVESALKGNAGTLALILACQQGGTIFGSTVLATKKIFTRNSFGVFIGLFISTLGIILIAIGALNGILNICIVGALIDGLTLPIANVHSQNIWQIAIPPEFQGRAYTVRRFLAQISAPIAMGLTGIVAELIGQINVLLYASISLIIILLYLWYFTALPKVDELVASAIQEEKAKKAMDLMYPTST